MLEKIQETLTLHGIKFDSIRALRGEGAEIPIYNLTYSGMMLEMWKRLKAIAPETGFWPLSIFDEYATRFIESKQQVVETRLNGSKQVVLPDKFEESLLRVNRAMLPGKRTSDYPLEKVCRPYYAFMNTGNPFEEDRLDNFVLIPATNSWSAFAHCTVDYSRGELEAANPTPTAWVRRWEEKYGAQLYLYDGSLQFYVERPPRTALEAYRLMDDAVRSGFGVEDIAQGFISGQSYAAHLVGNHYWEFWWD